ncbi:MAG: 30S ribosomal protein S6, partial [SAR202 cluster bacterium]|nr:30S ribosomal protein S6 [SAR202 cluster bacterium]
MQQENGLTFQRIRDYEVVMVLSPEATEAEASATVDRFSTFVADQGGSITHQENWGVRRLAYPIQRFDEGNYFLARFTMGPESVVELDRTLNASQDVLRHLVMKMDKKALAALEEQAEKEARRQAEAQARAERDAAERAEMEARTEREAEERAEAEDAPAAEDEATEPEAVVEDEPVAEEEVAEPEAAVEDEPTAEEEVAEPEAVVEDEPVAEEEVAEPEAV